MVTLPPSFVTSIDTAGGAPGYDGGGVMGKRMCSSTVTHDADNLAAGGQLYKRTVTHTSPLLREAASSCLRVIAGSVAASGAGGNHVLQPEDAWE